ncbi:MAG TPA: PQQ-binding-like beta-propeller repeat protein [Vicinamibacterales bacterium]|jgi:alcohol dehydrogenase (cytochrome c)|nr:PQQ-binding-like beta-propeller repeat protein [Vicinamibacterales bacterium]
MKSIFRSYTAAVLTCAALVSLSAAAQQTRPYVPVTDEMLWKPNPADWLMWRRTLDSAGYSPLNQIDKKNVAQLKMTWTRGMGPGNVQEATPLVYNGVMYLPNPSDYVQALDAKSGELLWEYRRKLPEDLGKFMPVFAINRNMAIYGDTVIDTSADDFVSALDVKTGAMRWETKILEYQKGAQQTSGPIIANGKVISGRGCEPEGGADACVITAHDARTGKELWRTRTIPRPGEPGAETWGTVPEDKRIHVGTWMVPSYDPQLNLIYIGTSVSSPAPKYMLAGNDKKYLYHNSTLALNADTGKIEWYYQHLVDHWDLDHPFERLLIDTAVAPNPKEVAWINPRLKPGEKRQVITGIPGKTGIVYTLDRKTGEFLWARPTVYQNVVTKIDGATGAVTENADAMFTAEGQTRQVCPGMNGGKNWPAGAYSPVTGLMYYPLQNLCMEATSLPPESSLYAISAKGRARPQRQGRRHGAGDLGGNGRHRLEVSTAGRHVVARGDGRGAGLRRRYRRPVPRLRRSHGESAVGSEPGLTGQRLSGDLRGQRQAVRGGEHRAVARRQRRKLHHTGDQAELDEPDVRVRAAIGRRDDSSLTIAHRAHPRVLPGSRQAGVHADVRAVNHLRRHRGADDGRTRPSVRREKQLDRGALGTHRGRGAVVSDHDVRGPSALCRRECAMGRRAETG